MRHWRSPACVTASTGRAGRTLPHVATTSRNRRETTASATRLRLSEKALKTFPRPRRKMYQPCHLISPAPVPCRLSTAPALRRSAASSSHRDVAPGRIVFRRCQRSRLAWISCLPPMNACDAQAKHPPAPTPTLRLFGSTTSTDVTHTWRRADPVISAPGGHFKRPRTELRLDEHAHSPFSAKVSSIVRSHPPIDRNRSKSPPTAGDA